jgi:uncharacterized membrane protein
MEMFISRLMRLSVTISGVFIAIGIGLLLITGNDACPVNIFDFQWVLYGDPFFAPSHIVFLGFIILIGTPLLRIAASVFVYAKSNDRTFTLITGMVMLVLVASMLLGVG